MLLIGQINPALSLDEDRDGETESERDEEDRGAHDEG
jgi:hypothetical protein